MKKEESTLYTALAEVQSKIDFVVAKDSDNPYYKSRYASLTAVLEKVRAVCLEHGLLIIQIPKIDGNHAGVITHIIHVASQAQLISELILPLQKNDPQAVGSAITYARRYSIAPLFGLVADEDDDGNAASQVQAKIEAPAKTKLPPKLTPKLPSKADRPLAISDDEIPDFDAVKEIKEVFSDAQEIQIKYKYDISAVDDTKLNAIENYVKKMNKEAYVAIERFKDKIHVHSEIELNKLKNYLISNE